MAERVKRASCPAVNRPSVVIGMIRCQIVPVPELGSQRSASENSRIMRMPRKKFGSAKPNTATLMITRSSRLLRRHDAGGNADQDGERVGRETEQQRPRDALGDDLGHRPAVAVRFAELAAN